MERPRPSGPMVISYGNQELPLPPDDAVLLFSEKALHELKLNGPWQEPSFFHFRRHRLQPILRRIEKQREHKGERARGVRFFDHLRLEPHAVTNFKKRIPAIRVHAIEPDKVPLFSSDKGIFCLFEWTSAHRCRQRIEMMDNLAIQAAQAEAAVQASYLDCGGLLLVERAYGGSRNVDVPDGRNLPEVRRRKIRVAQTEAERAVDFGQQTSLGVVSEDPDDNSRIRPRKS
jgi:hypothetical protein